MTQEVLKLALEALELALSDDQPYIVKCGEAITAIKEALAQPEQETVAWATKDDFYRELERELKRIREEMKIKSVTMRCKDYDIALPIIDTDFGRVLVGQVSTPPQRTEQEFVAYSGNGTAGRETDVQPTGFFFQMPEQEFVALEAVYETIIQWDEGGGKRSRRELARRIVLLYTHPPQRGKEPVKWADYEPDGVHHNKPEQEKNNG